MTRAQKWMSVMVGLGLILSALSPAMATNWLGVAGDWTDSTKWDAGVPTSSVIAYNGKTVAIQITQPGAQCLQLALANSSLPQVEMSGGDLTIGGTGSYARIGQFAAGNFHQTGGTVTLNSACNLYLGYSTGSNGTYTLDNGTLTSNTHEYIGYAGNAVGNFFQNGGAHSIVGSSTNLYIGYGNNTSTASGTYTISGGTLTVGNNIEPVYGGSSSTGGGSTGTFKVIGSKATINAKQWWAQEGYGTKKLIFQFDSGGISTINLSGGAWLDNCTDNGTNNPSPSTLTVTDPNMNAPLGTFTLMRASGIYYNFTSVSLPDNSTSPWSFNKTSTTLTVTHGVPTATPTFSPNGGPFNFTDSPQTIYINCADSGAVIRYTMGSNPADPTDNDTLYNSSTGVVIDNSTRGIIIKAKATGPGKLPSLVASATFAFAYAHDSISHATLAIDGNLSDWPAAAQWSSPYIWWNGTALTSTTKAKFAWNDAQDILYVAAQTNENSVRPGGYLVVGMTKDASAVPQNNDNSTQLGFFYDTTQPNNVLIFNETGGTTYGVAAACSYDSLSGNYTYEIAIPLWNDWRKNSDNASRIKQSLSAGNVIDVYSTMQDNQTTANGVDLSWYGNPRFYRGANAVLDGLPNAWTRAAALTLAAPSYTAADLAAMLAALDSTATGGGNWNAAMDLDFDGEVTSTDLAILLANMQ